MRPVALTGRAPAPPRCSGRLWWTASAVVLAWEATAGTTRVLAGRGVACRQVPYVTDVVRALPRPARAAVTVAVCGAVADHFGPRRWF